jgi:hypothetical protein
VQSKIILDKIRAYVLELEFVASLTYLENFFPNDTIPPFALLIPSEGLPATKREIKIKWARFTQQNFHLGFTFVHFTV